MPCLLQSALAIEIDSNEKVLELIQNPDFRNEFLHFAEEFGQRAMYIALDHSGIAIGTRDVALTAWMPTWLHSEARQTCLKDKQNRGIKSECRLLIENDRFVHPDISLRPSDLVAKLKTATLEQVENQSHWQRPQIARNSIKADPAADISSQGTSVVDTVMKRGEEQLAGMEDPMRIFADDGDANNRAEQVLLPPVCTDQAENKKLSDCLAVTAENRRQARLESIEPVTKLSEKQIQDLLVLARNERFKNYLRRYFQLPGQKALALALTEDSTATGLASGGSSVTQASRLALSECRENRIRKKIESGCFVYLLNDRNLQSMAGTLH